MGKATLSRSVTAPIEAQGFHRRSMWLKENRRYGSVAAKKRPVCRHVTVHITTFKTVHRVNLLFLGNQNGKSEFSWHLCCLIGLIISLLSACSSLGGNKNSRPPCPKTFLLKNANSLTYFRSGPTQDVTDILAEIAIIDFTGECIYNKKRTRAHMNLKLTFDIKRGPADKKKETHFQYFVAIPKFHPAPKGKNIFPLRAQFKGSKTRIKMLDEVSIQIPIRKNSAVDQYSVYIGLQLTSQQLKYNRSESNQILRR